jgi:glycosyltransferase involved in cell wall biosynthesis
MIAPSPVVNTLEPGAPARSNADLSGAIKKVVFVTHTPLFGGAEKHLLDLVQRFKQPGLELTILCAEGDPFSPRLDAHQNSVRVVRCEKTPKLFLDWVRLFRALKPDVVVFVHGVVSTFHCGAYVAARLCGPLTIYTLQHLIHPPPPKARGVSFGSIARRIAGYRTRFLLSVTLSAMLSNKTICVSRAIRDGLIKHYGFKPHKLVVIHNGVKASDFPSSNHNRLHIRNRLGIGPEDIVAVTVARLAPQKGIDILLRAAQQLLVQGCRCRWIIAGDGPLRDDITTKVRSWGLAGHVTLVGFQKDVRPYLQAADLFVLASLREGLPLSVLEAMASGLPCVLTDVGGNAEAVRHEYEGIVVAPDSAEELSKAVMRLSVHAEEREKMSKLAQSRVRELFDLDTQMKKIECTILA